MIQARKEPYGWICEVCEGNLGWRKPKASAECPRCAERAAIVLEKKLHDEAMAQFRKHLPVDMVLPSMDGSVQTFRSRPFMRCIRRRR